MFLFRFFLATLLLLQGLVNALYIGGHGSHHYVFERDWREATVLQTLRERDDSSTGPSCRPVCGSCGSSCSLSTSTKRSLIESVTSNATSADIPYDEPETTHELSKRVLRDIRQSSIGSYVSGKTAALQNPATNANSNLLSIIYSTNDYSFAVQKQFSDYTDTNYFNLGTAGLEGCTVVTLVSRDAVWMAHFFENLAFDPNYQNTGTQINEDTAFQQNCLNVMTGSGTKWKAKGDAIDPDLFTSNPVAWIMTPQREPTEGEAGWDNSTQEYAGRIAQIAVQLQALVPGVSVDYYNYMPDSAIYTQAYQGQALFEFDSNADGDGNANFRLWYEQNMADGSQSGII